MVTVSWKKVCLNQKEGGLGTKSLICLNEATNLKQCGILCNQRKTGQEF